MRNEFPLKYKIQSWFWRIRQHIPILREKLPKLTRLSIENLEYISPEQLENARAGYVVAINYAAYFISAIWSIFNTMLMANSVVFLGIGLVIINYHLDANYVLLFLCMIGLVLCSVWFLLVNQNLKFNQFYFNSARELEERYFPESVQTLSRGAEFAAGEKVYMTIDRKLIPFQLNIWQRTPAVILAYTIILIFSIMYFAILIFIVFRPIQGFLVRWG